MVICPSTRFKSIVLWPGMTHLVPRLSQNASYGWGPGAILSFKTFLSFINRLLVTNIQLKTSRGALFLPPSDAYVRSFFLSPLYFNKTLLHKSSEWSSFVSGLDWIFLLWRPRILASLHGSATTFHLGGLSRILLDKVRMLGALVLCSPSEHVFCCTLLTLWCACVSEWNTLHEASEEPCSAVLRWPHTAYGRNLLGVYTDLPMPRGTQCLLWPEHKWTKYVDRTLLSPSNFSVSLTIS